MRMNYFTAVGLVGIFAGVCIKIGVNAQYNLSTKNLSELLFVLQSDNPEAYKAFVETVEKVHAYRKYS